MIRKVGSGHNHFSIYNTDLKRPNLYGTENFCSLAQSICVVHYVCVCRLQLRVSFETSFDSKQPKLEPKLVSALSETKRLFRLFRFYTETESFDVSIELKQTKDQPKQFDREHILQFYTENLWFF
jgi:hypothetical protein